MIFKNMCVLTKLINPIPFNQMCCDRANKLLYCFNYAKKI